MVAAACSDVGDASRVIADAAGCWASVLHHEFCGTDGGVVLGVGLVEWGRWNRWWGGDGCWVGGFGCWVGDGFEELDWVGWGSGEMVKTYAIACDTPGDDE